MLRNALEDEIETIGRYVLRRKQAEALGHYGLAVEFDDLIRDESTHRDEIQLVLRRWDTG
jgi:bacterioferritin